MPALELSGGTYIDDHRGAHGVQELGNWQ
jgi:hypothetical protein